MSLVVHYFYFDALTVSSSDNFYLKKKPQRGSHGEEL